jgi:hypothetical protein
MLNYTAIFPRSWLKEGHFNYVVMLTRAPRPVGFHEHQVGDFGGWYPVGLDGRTAASCEMEYGRKKRGVGELPIYSTRVRKLYVLRKHIHII